MIKAISMEEFAQKEKREPQFHLYNIGTLIIWN